jgi:hypothetical protein
VVEFSRALDVRLSEWCCSVSMVLVQIPSREEQKFDSSKNLILTLFGLIPSILSNFEIQWDRYIVWLSRRLYNILYFLWLYNEEFIIQSQEIKYIIQTSRNKWQPYKSRALDVRLSEWCCSVSMVWVQIPSREEQKFDSSKNLILTLFGLIFRRIYRKLVHVI